MKKISNNVVCEVRGDKAQFCGADDVGKVIFCELVAGDLRTLSICCSKLEKSLATVTYSTKDNKLYSLIVDEKWRGFGFGTMLLKEAILRYNPKYIDASSCCGGDPVRLMDFYSKVGFTPYNIQMQRG